jgi:hypothetical protein
MKIKVVGYGRNLKEPTEREVIETALLEHAEEQEGAETEAKEEKSSPARLIRKDGASTDHMDPVGDIEDEGDLDPEAAAQGSHYALDERNRPDGDYRSGSSPRSANDSPYGNFRPEDSLEHGHARRA